MILHREIGGFSAGQKSKLTLGAAFWTFLGTKTAAIFGRSEFDMLEMLGWGWVGCVAWRSTESTSDFSSQKMRYLYLFLHFSWVWALFCINKRLVFLRKPHIIALDEPTNYIDMETLDALVQGLARYKGGIIASRWLEVWVGRNCRIWMITSKVWVCLYMIVVLFSVYIHMVYCI